MSVEIRLMDRGDRDAVLAMMCVFYDSPALLHHAPDDVLRRDVDDCVGDCPFVFGLVALDGGVIVGYLMAARSYSTEYGGPCVWIEDIYVDEAHRGTGAAEALMRRAEELQPEAVRFRLEVERCNARALAFYKKLGYETTEYAQMTKYR